MAVVKSLAELLLNISYKLTLVIILVFRARCFVASNTGKIEFAKMTTFMMFYHNHYCNENVYLVIFAGTSRKIIQYTYFDSTWLWTSNSLVISISGKHPVRTVQIILARKYFSKNIFDVFEIIGLFTLKWIGMLLEAWDPKKYSFNPWVY